MSFKLRIDYDWGNGKKLNWFDEKKRGEGGDI